MTQFSQLLRCGFTVCAFVVLLSAAWAKDEPKTTPSKPATTKPKETKPTTKPKSKYLPYSVLLKDAKTVPGLIKLHRKGTKLYAELGSAQFNQDFIILIAIARGIGQRPLLGGMPWGFGDDWIWQFRKVDERVHIVRRNVRFIAKKGSPEEKAVRLAFTDSVLYSLPIASKSPSGAYVVDLSPVFMSDLPQISQVLKGFSFSRTRSTWASVKGFKNNIELEVAAVYASSGTRDFETIADSRGATINVHYSISKLTPTGYKTRPVDDRVGFFMTVLKDFSKKGTRDQFVKYINRWDLKKKDSTLKMSPPKKPIVFYLEKTVPIKYRKPIKDGILEWNKAFEKVGFIDAIEVRQQRDTDTWDPEDINYNTFRWITSSAGFAMGPSRVNPKTGQILDADIVLDADFLQYWKEEYSTFTPKSIAAMTGGPLDLKTYNEQFERFPAYLHNRQLRRCQLHRGLSRQMAFGSIVQFARKVSPEDQEKMILQALKELTMHEVGHTLGLRHNFKASAYLSLQDINDPKKTKESGLSASVMDYAPINLVPKNMKQGDYFSTTIGPYDMWAIEYGYSSAKGVDFKKIAIRNTEPEHAYATDDDTRGIDPDPLSNHFDLGKDPVEFAKSRALLIAELWPDVVERVTKDGEGYQQARRAFNILLGTHGQAMFFTARFVGGLHTHRHHKGDKNAKAPFVVVKAKRQREALTMLEKQVFSDKPFQFPPKLYNQLAPTHEQHWGVTLLDRRDYPVHRVINMWQDRILAKLLSSLTLERLHDSELKVPADQDAFTTAELIERLTKTIFSEVQEIKNGKFTNRKPAISSLRRNLQRNYLRRLASIAAGNTSAPEDCQTIAYAEVAKLEKRMEKILNSNVKFDSYSRAHLEASAARIRKLLDSRLLLLNP